MDDSTLNWENCLECAVVTDIGLRRSNNQDSVVVRRAANEDDWNRRGHVFMVADGMGAHAAGELASKMAVDTVPHTYYKLVEDSPPSAIRRAVEDANTRIHTRGQANLDFRGMGTTTSVLLLLPDTALVAHVGDSRVYRLRGNHIEQLSFDHSLVWEMMASGKVREDQLPSFIPKNIITRSLGPSPQVQVDLEGPFPLAVGDTFLLCSDGLSGQVTEDEIGVFLATLPPEEAARVLVDVANLRGGPDNISVIVAKVRGTPSQGLPRDDLTSASHVPARPLHPAYWVVLGVLGLAALGLAMASQIEAAGFAGLAAVVMAVVMLIKKLSPQGHATESAAGPRLGRGPHTSQTCTVNNEFVEKLSRLAQQLREAATEENWKVDWTKFNAHSQRAVAARERKDFVQAVQAYSHAISFMMQELRDQRRRTHEPEDVT